MNVLRALIIGNSQDVTRRLLRELKRGGYNVVYERVDSPTALEEQLSRQVWEIAIADYSLPGFTGMDVLAMIQAEGLDIPIIFVSSIMDEDNVIKAIQSGAQDYIFTSNLQRLVPALRRALSEARMRQKQSQTEQMSARLSEYHITHDTLTGLANRAGLNDHLNAEVKRARRQGHLVAVLFLDIDNFKRVNDSWGHAAGDRLLIYIAARLRRYLRLNDTVARYGSDQFVLVSADINKIENVLTIVHKLRDAFEQPLFLNRQPLFVTFSIGIALFQEDGTDAAGLLKKAEIAMYRAKANGRDQFQFFAPAANARSGKLAELEAALRRAIDGEEFVLHYQPQVDLQTGRIVGAEALIRWQNQNQDNELIQPGSFLSALRDTGLILQVEKWVLRKACSDWRALYDAGLPAIRLAVNVSASQFNEFQWVNTVQQVLEEQRMPPDRLELEITENVLMENADIASETLRALRDFGIHFAIDDFGKGYSCLNLLNRFPLGTLKIDRDIVLNMEQSQKDASIVEACIFFGHRLGMKVVAKGVHSRVIYTMLKRKGCDYAQGGWVSDPCWLSDIQTMLTRNRRFL